LHHEHEVESKYSNYQCLNIFVAIYDDFVVVDMV